MPKWFHATHEKDLSSLNERAVKSVNSVGTFFTNSSENAKSLYGPNVKEASASDINAANPLVAHSTDFHKFFGSNLPLIEKHFGKSAANQLQKFPVDNARLRELDKKLSTQGTISGPEAKEANGLRESRKITQNALKDAGYMSDFKSMIQSAGHDSILFKDSDIDLRKGDKSHDVLISFHKHSIPVK